jgi:RNA-directed DNA polymerase
MEGRGEMMKAPIELQDLRRRIYVKAKAEPSWRFKRQGFGWKRWSRQWLYGSLGLYSDYQIRYYVPLSKAAPVR